MLFLLQVNIFAPHTVIIILSEFVTQPSSQNASEGTTAVFNCTGQSLSYHWLINDRLPEHQDNAHRGLSKTDTTVNSSTNLKIHLLHVPAIPINNGVSIQCLIYNIQSIPSVVAYLHIQGIIHNVHLILSSVIFSISISTLHNYRKLYYNIL